MNRGQRTANRRFLARLAVASAVASVLAAGGWLAGYRWNETESLPRGLWRVTGDAGQAVRGRIAFFCPPTVPAVLEAKARGYMREGDCNGIEPLFKPIVAVAGDVVQIDVDGISVNEVRIPNSAAIGVDGAGRSMPVLPHGVYTVEEGKAWAVSSYTSLSFDSRYIGPIDVASIEGQADPVWIFEDME